MKKEYIYIGVLAVLTVAGVMFKSIFLSGTIENTVGISKETDELTAKFIRDSLVQREAVDLRKIFEKNKRDDRSYIEVIADLLNVTESMLKASGIKYDQNSIGQDADEVRNQRDGTSSLFINLNFTSEYNSVKKLLTIIEDSDYIINVRDMHITRDRALPDDRTRNMLEERGLAFDQYNVKSPVNVRLRMEFVKFL